MSDKTTYIIKDIDKETWIKFRAKSLIAGYKSASEVLRMLIDIYAVHKNIPKKHNEKH